MAKRDKTDRLLGSLKRKPELKAPIATDMFLPNHSGDHSKGIVNSLPVNSTDIVNKSFVDTLTTNHPHQDVTTTSDPTFDDVSVDTLSATNSVTSNQLLPQGSSPNIGSNGARWASIHADLANFNNVDVNVDLDVVADITCDKIRVADQLTIAEQTNNLDYNISSPSGAIGNTLVIQRETTTAQTRLSLFPPPTGSVTSFDCYTNTTDPTSQNYNRFRIAATPSIIALSSTATGSASQIPLKISVGSGNNMQLESDGDVKFPGGDILHTGGDIKTTGDYIFTDNGGNGLTYAGIYLYNNSTSDSIASGSYVQLTRFESNSPSNNLIPNHTNDHITVATQGVYKIDFTVSFSGSGSVEWTGGIFKNNGATQLTDLQISRKLGASGDVGAAGVTGIVQLEANDTIEVWFKQTSGVNKNITIKHANLNILKIGAGS